MWIAVTFIATLPLLTYLQDLWNLGVIMKVKECYNVAKQRELKKSVNASVRKDRKAMKDSDQQYMLGIKNQQSATYSFNLASTEDMARDMGIMRDLFRGRVVRRTVDSLDEEGKPISGLGPPQYHDLHLTLNNAETVVFERMVDDVLQDDTSKAVTLGRVSSLFCDVKIGGMENGSAQGGRAGTVLVGRQSMLWTCLPHRPL